MATHTIIIYDQTNKTKYLLGLIREMAKDEKNIEIDPSIPNKETIKAITEARKGKTRTAKSAKDLFESI
jgi:antitoxin component of RelBE/YafQ-DinJ toxin-antitoxin module